MQYLIKQQMSGTGSIHSIASEHYDREIKGPGKYAVVLASYYGGRGYTTHHTTSAAIRKAKQMRGYSLLIIDEMGYNYDVRGDELIKIN